MHSRMWESPRGYKALCRCAYQTSQAPGSPNLPLHSKVPTEMLLNQASGKEEKAVATACPRCSKMSPLLNTRSQGVTDCPSGWGSGQVHLGVPARGSLGAASCLHPRESGSCSSDGGAGPRAESTYPGPCLQNHIFQTRSSSKPLIGPPGSKAPLPGSGVLSVRSAQRPVQGDFIRSSPTCLCKHPQRPLIKVLLFFCGRCLF